MNIPVKRENVLHPVNLLVLGYFIVAIICLKNYVFIGSVNMVLALVAIPFAWKIDPAKKGNYRYGWLMLALLVICFLMPVKTLLYFSIGFALLFFTESFYGKTNLLSLFIIVFSSPVFQYFGDVFSFPIRLELTKLAGSLFNVFGSAAEVRGNMIIHQGNEFSVDPACMGLSMITASLLSGIMLIGFYQDRFQRKSNTGFILLYLGIIFLLNIVANLIRIVVLVQFRIQPGTLSHDLAGLACLVIYVFIPAVGIAKWLVKRSSVRPAREILPPVFSRRYIAIHLLLLAATVFISFRVLHSDTFDRFEIPSRVDGYTMSFPAQGIVKLDKPGSLVYVKYIRGFYDTEHNPMICWTGGGYQFKNVEIENIGNYEVFTGTITNGDEKFYSAWWYDNGINHTTRQLEWRWDLARGADHYVLVNISCPSKDKLRREVEMIIQQKTLMAFFSK